MHVGMNRRKGAHLSVRLRVPHARGDEPVGLGKVCPGKVSSPCTWG